MAHIKAQLDTSSADALKTVLHAKSAFAIPKIRKVVLNMGIGKIASANVQVRDRVLEETARIISLIAGQKPAPRRAKKSIAGFKVREGEVIAYVVTFRGQRMRDFIERFFNIALPRTRDFRGISLKNVDLHGNLTIGVREHIVFTEVAGEETRQLYGMEVTIVPTTKSREKALALYRALGFPFEKEH